MTVTAENERRTTGFHILIVDDEPNIRSGLAKGLAKVADFIETAQDVNEALGKFDAGQFQLVVADVRLPGDRSGLDLVSLLRKRQPDVAVIVITAHGTVETAVDAMRRGAFDFITKPIDLNLIRQQVQKALDHHRLKTENRQLKGRLADAGEISGMIGNGSAMKAVSQQRITLTDAIQLVVRYGQESRYGLGAATSFQISPLPGRLKNVQQDSIEKARQSCRRLNIGTLC